MNWGLCADVLYYAKTSSGHLAVLTSCYPLTCITVYPIASRFSSQLLCTLPLALKSLATPFLPQFAHSQIAPGRVVG